MGCDITVSLERKTPEGWQFIECRGEVPFWRWYGLFGFLAGVRNRHSIEPIAPLRGLPDDVTEETRRIQYDEFPPSISWLTLKELEEFDYEKITIDSHKVGSARLPCEGVPISYRSFLGKAFFLALKELRSKGADRIVFWFNE